MGIADAQAGAAPVAAERERRGGSIPRASASWDSPPAAASPSARRCAERSDASPDFLVSLYGPSLQDVNVPAHAPPLFIAVGSTHFNVTNGCLALFAAWKAAGKPAEIHVYDRVSAGFGMTKRGLPVDSWTDRLLRMARRAQAHEGSTMIASAFSIENGVRARRLLLVAPLYAAFAATVVMAQPAPGGSAVASRWWAPGEDRPLPAYVEYANASGRARHSQRERARRHQRPSVLRGASARTAAPA